MEFKLYEDKAGGWRWSMISKNGRIIADSAESYVSKSNVERAVNWITEGFAEGSNAVSGEGRATAALQKNPATVADAKKPTAAPPSPKPASSASSASAKGQAKGGALEYERDIKPVAYALAKTDYAALVAIWAQFGVKVGGELKPEQFEDALAVLLDASA